MADTQRWALWGSLAVTMALGACSSTPVAPESTTAVAPAATASTGSAPLPAATSKVANVTVAPYLDPQNPLNQKRSVYFDFDQYSVRAGDAPVVELHGKFLAAHPGVAIRVQGNTDEAGGTEYNLALGQKRAEAVVKALKVYGAKEVQLEAVSFGEEKPRALGHDETAYAQNRRADLAYPER